MRLRLTVIGVGILLASVCLPVAANDNINARFVLSPPEGAANQDASGGAQLQRNPVRDAIFVRVQGLEPGATFAVKIENGASETIGNITTIPDAGGNGGGGGGDDGDDDDNDDAPGSGLLKLDTKRGDPLPLEAGSVADLEGTTISVCDAEGNPVLEGAIGEVPTLGGDAPDRPETVMMFSAELSGDQEVPPVESSGSGEAGIKLLGDGTLKYSLEVADIAGVTQAHIHVGAAGTNGPVVAFLFGFVEDGVDVDAEGAEIAEGILTDDDVMAEGGLDGTVAALVEEMLAGNTYVNVHTLANPPGEIRGQIMRVGRPDDTGGGGATEVTNEPSFAVVGLHDASFLRGDTNADSTVNIADAVRTLLVLFDGAEYPYCMDAMDSNDDGSLDISDSLSTLIYLFAGGDDLPAPGAYATPGYDPTPDDLFCDEVRMLDA